MYNCTICFRCLGVKMLVSFRRVFLKFLNELALSFFCAHDQISLIDSTSNAFSNFLILNLFFLLFFFLIFLDLVSPLSTFNFEFWSSFPYISDFKYSSLSFHTPAFITPLVPLNPFLSSTYSSHLYLLLSSLSSPNFVQLSHLNLEKPTC